MPLLLVVAEATLLAETAAVVPPSAVAIVFELLWCYVGWTLLLQSSTT